MKLLRLLPAIMVGALLPSLASGYTIVYSDDFNADSSANYTETSVGQSERVFAFDYGADPLGIPAAPNTTDSSTLGLRMAVNVDGSGAAALTLHTNDTFSGEYEVAFDMWINANGPFPLGGTGSTEYFSAGVGGDGTNPNSYISSTLSGSGVWTFADGEGQSSVDWGTAIGGTADTLLNHPDPIVAGFGGIDVGALPQASATQTGVTTTGSAGFAWHEVSLLVSEKAGTVTWSMDGQVIDVVDVSGDLSVVDGSVTIGYLDRFSSQSNAPIYSFGLIDNLVVTQIPEPTSALMLMASVAGLAAFRRFK